MKISFYDTKPYDRIFFDKENEKYGYEIRYFETKLSKKTAVLSKDCDAAVAFVNDDIDKDVISVLHELGVGLIAMRCAGYNNVDLSAAHGKIKIARVPVYSPYAVAEHAMAMLLTLNRRIHKAFLRTRDYNFSLNGLTGFDLHGKNVGIIGTGNIGSAFIDICTGFGMNVYAYDVIQNNSKAEYVSLDEIFSKCDVISLHCPLTKDTYHIINENSINKMKDGVFIVNTSRGSLIDSQALLNGITNEKIGGACLDVYEEETEIFHEDFSDATNKDKLLVQLISMPNVIVTSHQGFLTGEALSRIAEVTLKNISDFSNGLPLENEVFTKSKKLFSGELLR